MTELFGLATFEKALPVNKSTKEPLWHSLGIIDGEYAYRIPVDTKAEIMVFSSIHPDGDPDGDDECIKCWLVNKNGLSLGRNVSKWTTRLPGWEIRLAESLRTLWRWRKASGDCPTCGLALGIYKVSNAGSNKGRIFAKCGCVVGTFVWLT